MDLKGTEIIGKVKEQNKGMQRQVKKLIKKKNVVESLLSNRGGSQNNTKISV